MRFNRKKRDEVGKGKKTLQIDKIKKLNRKGEVEQRWRIEGRKRELCITGKVSTRSHQEVDPILRQYFCILPPVGNL